MPKEFQPYTPTGPDPKWRYMWRVGPRPTNTRFKVVILLRSFHKILLVYLVFSCAK